MVHSYKIAYRWEGRRGGGGEKSIFFRYRNPLSSKTNLIKMKMKYTQCSKTFAFLEVL